MTCEWAEGNLSAYLDDALDPQTRQEVGAHLEHCSHCQALADEYRRNDSLLSTLAPIEPPAQLRARLFESPAYAELLREQRAEAEADANHPDHVEPIAARRMSLYLRTLVPLAALLMIALGVGLLFRQGMLPFGGQSTGQKQTTTIGGPSSFGLPLSAGPRLVYLSGGALWSVAEYAPNSATGAPGAPQQLTPAGMQVAAWSVSPLSGKTGGARIAYVDARTGALHIVHSDGQADSIVGALTPTQSPGVAFWVSPAGRAALASLTWSPDGARLAYVSVTAAGGSQAHVYALASSSSDEVIGVASEASITQFTWSADGKRIAFVTGAASGATGESVQVWQGAGHALHSVAASPREPSANVAQLAWSGTTLTWAVQRDGATVGVYALTPTASAATSLTPTGASYTTAGFTPTHGGVWLLAGAGTLSEARLATLASATQVATQVATLATDPSHIVWSPDGAQAALTLGGQLALWRDGAGLTPLAQGVASQPAPVWSPDGASVAVAQAQGVSVYRVGTGAATQVAQLEGGATAQTLAWAADGRNLAIAESRGLLLAPSDGAGSTLLTSHSASGDALSWSLAG